MKILVAWEDTDQLELMNLYLSAGENEVESCSQPEEFLEQLTKPVFWDVILLSVHFGGADRSFNLFSECRRLRAQVPIVCGCMPDDIFRLARFMVAGMKSYILRDAQGDFLFLLLAMLDGVVASARAEREQKIAEKLREEVESVRKVQETLIPKDIRTPDRYQVVARYEPAQVRVLGGQPVIMAGGDYYDLFSVRDDRFVIIVGDASGHGMKACMSVVTMHTLVRMLLDDHGANTVTFVRTVNRSLCSQSVVTSDGGFITLAYGVLDATKNEFRWCSAGHPPPMLQNLDTGEVIEMGGVDAGGLPLGLYDGAEYEEYRFTIPPRSRVLIYTDGLTDAFPDTEASHNIFGVDGIMRSLQATVPRPLEESLQALFDDSLAFTFGNGRHDDTSAVLLERGE